MILVYSSEENGLNLFSWRTLKGSKASRWSMIIAIAPIRYIPPIKICHVFEVQVCLFLFVSISMMFIPQLWSVHVIESNEKYENYFKKLDMKIIRFFYDCFSFFESIDSTTFNCDLLAKEWPKINSNWGLLSDWY